MAGGPKAKPAPWARTRPPPQGFGALRTATSVILRFILGILLQLKASIGPLASCVWALH